MTRRPAPCSLAATTSNRPRLRTSRTRGRGRHGVHHRGRPIGHEVRRRSTEVIPLLRAEPKATAMKWNESVEPAQRRAASGRSAQKLDDGLAGAAKSREGRLAAIQCASAEKSLVPSVAGVAPPDARRDSHNALEHTSEVTLLSEACLQRDSQERRIFVEQELLSPRDACAQQPLVRRYSDRGAECPTEVGLREPDGVRHLAQAETLREARRHEVDRRPKLRWREPRSPPSITRLLREAQAVDDDSEDQGIA